MVKRRTFGDVDPTETTSKENSMPMDEEHRRGTPGESLERLRSRTVRSPPADVGDGMNAPIAPIVMNFPLDAVTLDIELQPRAVLHDATWQEYLNLLGDGTALPPVVVFGDGEKHWLADGYHRWHAHKAVGSKEIAAVVRKGSRDEALRFSLGANATHGKRREVGDYARSYAMACKYSFVRPDDIAAVRSLLGCSIRWAYDLTAPARKKIEDEREAEIAAKKADGKSVRVIARETGLSKSAVGRAVGAPDLQPAKAGHTEPPQEPPGQAKYLEMTSRRGERWWGALRALQTASEQASVDQLLADRYQGNIEHVFEPALRKAHAWINELYGRYFEGR